MSRIDKAIEMATKKRQSADREKGEDAVESAPVSDAPFVPEEAPQDVPHQAAPEMAAPLLNNPFLVTAHGTSGAASEQYRKLKSSIVKLTQLGRFDKSLMVTSATGGEGKTLTSINLAITLAQEYDHTVLLVEADIRCPSIMRYMELESSIGLTDCVLDGIDVGQALVKTGIGKLSILPAGRLVDNPVELFSSNRMQELLQEIKSRYPDRYVIVDTTPLLPFAEPQFIANVVDGVLFVVREGYTSTDKLTKALGLLKNHNLLGVVCNAVRQYQDNRYGYYGYYGYK
ncbi:XrtA-associated tyrosine autokinase [Desulfuromonas acetoxidans]|uniref:non-specific protein-tyrosine kinase n=1 Tax=Desulfuromonas acetoxidans (strain DSM 684 / 11070) TaxID=281689 RepID=Q1K3Z5_DESA6|nr:XrtA-associated tyrosine autokinase [Desulfuromonas acetoxidans]EAT17308.1 Protein-tyrosine kinase [Desulfuromonas acetoxidans DSM 684]MBF0644307.1 polysaccharide biosynthesis tyrosine autokinase [Desulfuromonas acetoxidans]NVD26224.1 polysaccharide biosynthesis tyrosine autokinase [Desulfuromonas acetoxidans]NVE15124.1 polysaccharide biosynthesis tyrosine autokinase [Desulfuromonas acetoxidans]